MINEGNIKNKEQVINKSKIDGLMLKIETINNEQDLYDYFHFTKEEIAEISLARIPSYIVAELLQ